MKITRGTSHGRFREVVSANVPTNCGLLLSGADWVYPCPTCFLPPSLSQSTLWAGSLKHLVSLHLSVNSDGLALDLSCEILVPRLLRINASRPCSLRHLRAWPHQHRSKSKQLHPERAEPAPPSIYLRSWKHHSRHMSYGPQWWNPRVQAYQSNSYGSPRKLRKGNRLPISFRGETHESAWSCHRPTNEWS